MKKKILIGTIGFSLFATGAYAGTIIDSYKTPRGNTATIEKEEIHKNRIGVTVNGKAIKSNTWYDPEEKTFVPLREIAEMLGAEVSYNSKTMAADIITKDAPPTTSDVGKSRSNAAGIGQKVVIISEDLLDGTQTIELTLTNVIEGQEAERMIKEANMFNRAPQAGHQYVLAKFKAKALDLENEPMEIYDAQFEAVSKSGVAYDDFFSVVTPKPDLQTDLYEGGEHDGWVAFEVEDGDSPKVVFLKGWDGETWFDLGM